MAITETTNCAQCGVEFTYERKSKPRKYCSQKCRENAQYEKLNKTPTDEHKLNRKASAMRTCQWCGVKFQKPSGREPKTCSLQCARNLEAGCDLRKREVVRKEAALYRKWSLGYNRGVGSRKYQRWSSRARTPCIDCGKPVGVSRTKIRTALRCADCAEIEKKRLHAISREARKIKQRGVTVEQVDPIKVFERDGWRCHICGGKVLSSRRGTYHPSAPELDHIIPISKGGEHSYANTACSHRKCNATKSDSILGQPSLLACG